MLLGLCVAAAAGHASEQVIDGIAAQVGSEIVLISEVDQISADMESRMREAGLPGTEILMMRAEALERLIEARLIERVVKQTELEASDEEVNAAIAQIAQENNLTVKQLTEGVTAYGLPFSTYRSKIKDEIERAKVINTMIRSRVNVEPKEVEELFVERYSDQRTGGEQVHLRHILVPAEVAAMRDKEAACPEVKEAREVIVSGRARFQDVARSISVLKAETGGDLGWLHADDIAAWMKLATQDLAPGGISPVVATNFGCNLLMVVAREGFQPVTLPEAAPELQREIFDRKTSEEYVRFIDRLRDQTYIQRKGLFAETSRLLRENAATP